MAEPSSSTAMTTTTTTSSSPSSSSLQGPRPAPLRVRRDSRKIRKPPSQVRQPVIIYTVSPKVVHAEPSEFMSVVQRLTGAPSASSSLPPPLPPGDTRTHHRQSLPFPFFPSSFPPAPAPQLQFPFQLHQQAGGPMQLSPAARLAAIHQQTSQNTTGVFGADDVGGLPPLPSILSPVPGSLPAVPPSFFSPPAGAGGDGINLFGELISPAFHGATSQSYPTTLPSPLSGGAYYWDLFNNHHHHNL